MKKIGTYSMNKKTTKKCTAKTTVTAPVATATAAKPAPAKCAAKKCAAKPTTKEVTFTVHADKGKAVYLAGDFNAWSATAEKMTFKGGVYTTTISLAAGEYQYKFVIDGTWCADPENVNSVANDQGTFNSVIIVK